MARFPSRWSLRARVFLVVTVAALTPVALIAMTHWLEDVQQDRTDVELDRALRETLRAIDQPDVEERVTTIARRHAVRIRVIDVARRTTLVDVDRERNTHAPEAPLAWIWFPSDVPTLDELDRSWPALVLRPEVREASSERAGMGCRTDPRGAVLVCHAAQRRGDRVVYVQRGFVRGAVRAIYERNRELARLVVVLLPVALALGWWLSRRMIRPLEALRAEALARARAVDPSTPLPIDRSDEIGDVKQAFNALLGALRDQKSATESFVADLAHEAKNPVASIRACADALASGDLTEERRERIAGNLRRSSERLDRLVSEVLDLARIEAGMPRESQAEVDLVDLARALVEEAQAERSELELVVNANGPLKVRGVPVRLEAALRNLIDNAASFATKRVEVQLTSDGDRAIVRVQDDGPGIEPELALRVFDRFFTTRGSRRGTGLGLAMVRAIAIAHGGQARAERRETGGATFELSLPIPQ